MNEEKAVELEELMRSYYREFPFGHTMTDAHNAYSRGATMNRRMHDLSTELDDNHEYLKTLIKLLKSEGLIKEI